MGGESKVFTYADVSAHITPHDCWVIINGKVYNVSSFLIEHPGGDQVLLEKAGKDASEEFEDVGHGSAARLMLDEFYMGEVDPNTKLLVEEAIDSPPAPAPALSKDSKDKLGEMTTKYLQVLGILLGLALAIILFNFST